MKSKSGFTIVELLIVIVVIAVLATVSVVAYNGVQARARFTKVQNDLTTIRDLLEVYKGEKGVYPATPSSGWLYSDASPDGFVPNLVPAYTSSLPRFTADSVVDTAHCYVYRSDGANYKIIRLSQPSIPSAEQALVPSSMKDTYNGSDRYGYWSEGGASF